MLNMIPKNSGREVGGRTTKISGSQTLTSNRIVSANILVDTLEKEIPITQHTSAEV